jgi:hypothetical protein
VAQHIPSPLAVVVETILLEPIPHFTQSHQQVAVEVAIMTLVEQVVQAVVVDVLASKTEEAQEPQIKVSPVVPE